MYYTYNKQNINLSVSRVAQCLEDLEKTSRTTEFQYYKPKLTKVQVDGMSAGWNKEIFQQFREYAKKIAGENKISPEVAYQAVLEILLNVVPKNKAENSATAISTVSLKRALLTDIAVSMVFNLPFDIDTTGSVRTYKDQKLSVRNLLKANKIVVDCNKVNDADIFIFAFVNDEIPTSRLIGWKRQKEVRLMNRGNKTTDPDNCKWSEMSYWCNFAELNPMSSLIRENAIAQLPEGFLLETVPEIDRLPIPNSYLDEVLKPVKDASDSFYSFLGEDDVSSKEKTKPVSQPAETGSGELEF